MVRIAKIHQVLESLGFSSYESKAYSALLREHPLTGYKLSKVSGVPRSRIYETLERLCKKGYVHIQDGRPSTYIPVAGEEFILKTERSLFDKVDVLRDWFDTLTSAQKENKDIWKIEGRDNILDKAEYMIQNAAGSLAISGWAEDLHELRTALERAVNRDVTVLIVSRGVFPGFPPKIVYMRSWEGDRKTKIRDLSLAVDRSNALLGSTTPEEKCSAALTESPGLVFIAREYILHEVVINWLMKSIPPGIKRELMAFYNKYANL